MPRVARILHKVHSVAEFLQCAGFMDRGFCITDRLPGQFTGKKGAEWHIMPYFVKYAPAVGHHDILPEYFPMGAGESHMERCNICKIPVCRVHPTFNISHPCE